MHILRAALRLFLATVATDGSVLLAQTIPPAPGRLSNASVRAFTGNGNSVLIAGFILSGTSSRTMLLRAIGPGLAPFGVTNYLADPELQLYKTQTQSMLNDSWSDNPDLIAANQRLGAFQLVQNSRDAAVLMPLSPGAYTAHARGRNGTTGEVLLELYDAAAASDNAPALVNFSLRGELTSPGALLIGGFIISEGAPKRVVLRAIGPTLANFGVTNAAGNPRVRLFRNGVQILENDDWATGADPTATEQAFSTVGAFSLARTSKDAAIVATLAPGAYTAHVDDPAGGTGVVLMEIYDMDPPPPGSSTPPASSDPANKPTVSILAINDRMTEGASPGATVMLIRSGDLSVPQRVGLTRSGTASIDDYTGVPDTVTFPIGSATTTFVVAAWADSVWEPSEILTLSLAPDAAYTISGAGRAHLVIRDSTPLTGTGWKGEYFNNKTLTGTPVLTRNDPEINFSFGSASPGTGVNDNGFSARWTGLLQIDTTQDYTFVTTTDDGVRLYIDGQLVINRFTNGSSSSSATVNLTAGVRYPVRMEYYDNTGTATAKLAWQAAGMPQAIIAQSRVFDGTTIAPAITSATSAIALTGGPFSYSVAASGSPTSYTATNLPAGLSFDPATGEISGVPTEWGNFQVVLTASNAQGTGSEILNLQVLPSNPAPVSERWTTPTSGPGLLAPATAANSTASLTQLESQAVDGTAFERIRAYITAPLTGNYTFWISASGAAELYLADSDQPGDAVLRARVPAATTLRNWSADPAQQSMAVALTAGKSYYVEVRHVPSATGAHVSVGWKKPGDTTTGVSEIVPLYTLAKFDEFAEIDAGKTLYLASLRPLSGVISPASGTVSLLFDEPTKTATIAMRFTGLSSGETAAYIYAGDIGATGPLIQALPGGQFSGFVWQMKDTGNLTAQDLADALRDGLLYVVVHTSGNPTGELRGQFGVSAGSTQFRPPAAPPALPSGAPDLNAASRFLQQATFGPTRAEMDRVVQIGFNAWLDEQLAMAPSYHMPYIDSEAARLGALTPAQGVSQNQRQEVWWDRAVHAPDQLRQRVAFALSEIFVTSDVGVLEGQVVGLTTYYDMLLRDSFGNFRTLLEDVTLSPAMGNYLSMIRNRKADPAKGIYPDENYAREVMQLFTIGLNKLHPDGTVVLDTNGLPIPTYTQENITGLARVFTGWAYNSTAANPSYLGSASDFRNPMMMYESAHETGEKRLLESAILPGGATGTQDLKTVLDMLFNHPNVGPFICRQLIQRLVTSNPSPAYVYRVARVFADNGAGVRGDLAAVVRAILTDYEARSPIPATAQGAGKVREPLLRVTQLWRAFNGTTTSGKISYNNPQNNLGQAALRSTTVFNFFEPGFVSPGILAQAGLVAPEFQITTETSIVNLSNSLRNAVFSNLSSVTLDLAFEQGLAGTPAQLVDSLNTLLMGGQMSSGMRTNVINAVTAISASNPLERARTALNLVTISPEYSVQK